MSAIRPHIQSKRRRIQVITEIECECGNPMDSCCLYEIGAGKYRHPIK